MSQAFNETLNGNLPLQIALFASYFVYPGGDTVQFDSTHRSGLLSARQVPVNWTDNAIQIANYTFQIQQDPS